jgi:hypothetical protein
VSSMLRWKSLRFGPAALVALASLALVSVVKAQEIAVQIESGAAVKLSASDIAALPHQSVSVDDHGKTVKFEGVPVKLVLEKAGVSLGESLRGKRMATAFWWKRPTTTAWCLRCLSWTRDSQTE